MYPKKPFPASYWLKSDKIAAGALPTATDRSDATKMIRSLVEAGIETVINLLEPDEFENRTFSMGSYPNYTSELKQLGLGKGLDISCVRFPIIDFGIPSKDLMIDILNCIDENLTSNRKVYFHCYAGLGRTGTVAGCWLVRHGMEGNDALQELFKIRHAQGVSIYGNSPQSDQQVCFVRAWKKGQ